MEAAAVDLDTLSAAELAAYEARDKWLEKANHPDRKGKQIPPRPDVIGRDYNIWVACSGRGFGKSISLSQVAWWECHRVPGIFGNVVSPDKGEVRTVMFEGPAGILDAVPKEVLLGGSVATAYRKTPDLQLRFASGSMLAGFGATDEGDEIRGANAHFAVGDECAKWDKPAGNFEKAFHNLALSVRLPYPDGTPSRIYLGMTPKPIAFLGRLLARPDVYAVRGSTYENLANLAENFKAEILALAGTALGKQEIMGELISLDDIGIFHRSWIQLWPAGRKLPEFSFIIESYDTAFEEDNFDPKTQEPDYSACTVWGVFNIAAAFPEEAKRRGPLNKLPRYGVMLCEAWRDRIGFPELLDRAIKQHRVKWGSPGRKSDLVLIENKGSGISLRQMMAQHGIPTWPFNPGNQSKTQRAHAVSPIMKQKMVFVPESGLPERKGMPRDWCEDFLQEVTSYAGKGSVEHDDYLDSMVQVLLYLHATDMLVPSAQVPVDPDVADERSRLEAKLQRDREKAAINPYAM